MRLLLALSFATALAAGEASASSFVVPEPMTAPLGPSMIMLSGTTPPASIAEPIAPPAGTPSIVALGEPVPPVAREVVAAIPQPARKPNTIPMVMRGGLFDTPFPTPAATMPEQPSTETLLDPNDRGTSAKRRALKRQEERLRAAQQQGSRVADTRATGGGQRPAAQAPASPGSSQPAAPAEAPEPPTSRPE